MGRLPIASGFEPLAKACYKIGLFALIY